jgi:hypothetical protein
MKHLQSGYKLFSLFVFFCIGALQYSCEPPGPIEIEPGAIIDYDGNSYSTKEFGTQNLELQALILSQGVAGDMMARLLTRGTMQISGQQQSTVTYEHGAVTYTPLIPRYTGT